MKILYLSCHSVLENLEVSLFHEMGHSVFSPGAYLEPTNATDLRPGIPGMTVEPKLLEMYHQISGQFPGKDFKNHLTKEFVDNFDVIIVMHMPHWIERNWEVMKHKPVILRTIGQSNRSTEKSMKRYREEGLKIVRYSPKEEYIPGYIGMDAIIRFYQDPEEFNGYVGSVPRIVNVSQAMFGNDHQPSRGDHMSKPIFDQVVAGFDWKIFGPDNEYAYDHNGGRLSYEDLKSMLRMNRVFLYTGTRPAQYSLGFIEAWLTGIPVVSIGRVLGNEVYNQKTFEVPDLIGQNGVAGFYSDSVEELRDYCKQLLDDPELAKRVGEAGRQQAIKYFGKQAISEQWQKYLMSL